MVSSSRRLSFELEGCSHVKEFSPSPIFGLILLLPSATKSRRLCFYTCLILFTGGGAIQHALQVVSQHALQQGGACSRGCLLWGVACSEGLSAPGGALLWGGCGNPPPPKADGYCCGRYASYWNAFLFCIKSTLDT